MRFLFFHLKKLYKSAHRAALALEQQLCLVRAVLHLYPTHIHRLIIPRWAKRFVFLQIEPFALLFCHFGLSALLAHILQQVTQPTGLSSLNYGTVGQRKVRINLTDEASPTTFSHLDVLFIYAYAGWCLLAWRHHPALTDSWDGILKRSVNEILNAFTLKLHGCSYLIALVL